MALFTGPMASGKSTALLAGAALLGPSFSTVLGLKSGLDTRWAGATTSIRSRAGLELPAQTTQELLPAARAALRASHPVLFVVDEAQFFPDLLPFAKLLLQPSCQHSLLLAGLDYDYKGEPFGQTEDVFKLLQDLPVGQVAGLHTHAHRLAAACTKGTASGPCNRPARFTQRLCQSPDEASEQVLVGDLDMYQPACAEHHSPPTLRHSAWSAR